MEVVGGGKDQGYINFVVHNYILIIDIIHRTHCVLFISETPIFS